MKETFSTDILLSKPIGRNSREKLLNCRKNWVYTQWVFEILHVNIFAGVSCTFCKYMTVGVVMKYYSGFYYF